MIILSHFKFEIFNCKFMQIPDRVSDWGTNDLSQRMTEH